MYHQLNPKIVTMVLRATDNCLMPSWEILEISYKGRSLN